MNPKKFLWLPLNDYQFFSVVVLVRPDQCSNFILQTFTFIIVVDQRRVSISFSCFTSVPYLFGCLSCDPLILPFWLKWLISANIFFYQVHNFTLEMCLFLFHVVKCCKFRNSVNFSKSAPDFITVPFPVVQL